MSIFSVTHILSENFTDGISYMMPFGGGNPTGSNSVTDNPISGNPVVSGNSTSGNSTNGNSASRNFTSGNPASNNQGGNVADNQLIHQPGNQRRNRRGNPLLNQGEGQRISRPRRRGNLLVTRSINPILSQENELRRCSEIITRNRNRNVDFHSALREHRYVGDFFQGRYVIRTSVT
jgi:hypothetical protein